MGKCIFKTEEIKRIVKHALQSTQWRQGYDKSQPVCPAIMFVHDEGVYCMSSGIPADMTNDKSAFCSYARECNPNKHQLFYQKSRMLVGGSDFYEVLPVTEDYLVNCDNFEEMIIDVSEEELSLSFRKPKALKQAV
jgi:hypothetical protein